MIRGIAIAGLIAVLPSATFGQPGTAPSFEVASIKLHQGPVTQVSAQPSGPRIRITAYGLVGLIMDAYDVKFDEISGGPGWMNTDRFDIEAVAQGEVTPAKAQLKLMLQSLLMDRFKLKVHRETRVMPVYALVVGKGGPKLKESAPDAEPSLTSIGTRSAQLTVVKGGMDRLAIQLSSSPGVDRPVIDKTGLTGSYDYKLRWTFEVGTSTSDTDSVSIFTALQQLGLKLEPRKAPIEILVVDHAERPSAN
jgi:uncharacterized protein (TIGR03435 family)